MEKIEIAKKLKVLSEKGVTGEKENATKLLEKLMKKYRITDEEIKNEETRTVWITLKNNAEIQICSQILYAFFNNTSLWQRKGHRTRYWTELTVAQEIEFKYMLSVYIDNFYKEQDVFIKAYIQKNRIFPINTPVTDISELSDEERRKILKASIMAEGIETIRIRKVLNS